MSNADIIHKYKSKINDLSRIITSCINRQLWIKHEYSLVQESYSADQRYKEASVHIERTEQKIRIYKEFIWELMKVESGDAELVGSGYKQFDRAV
jgi:hypothetical protein